MENNTKEWQSLKNKMLLVTYLFVTVCAIKKLDFSGLLTFKFLDLKN